MKKFDEIKTEWESKNYSLSDLKKSIVFFSIIRILFTELFFFLISTIPFIIGFGILYYIFGFSSLIALIYLIIHLLFYTFYAKKEYVKNILPNLKECDLIIKALKEIKSSKLNP